MSEEVLVALGWILGWVLLWRVPRLDRSGDEALAVSPGRPDAGTTRDPTVSVIVPARNEEHNLPGLLASLRMQEPALHEVIVVDDGSTDRTAQVAAAGGAWVLPAGPVPAGWTGKPWACWQGARAASGSVLVFLDADVTVAPEAIEALVRRHRRHGGLLSVQPYHRVRRPYEWLSAVFNIMAFMGVGAASLMRPRAIRAAFGPCLVVDRADYEAVGGHHEVRAQIVEDVALGRAFADAGFPVEVLGGGRLVTFRMYPEGVGQLLEGWTKNIASGAAGTSPLRAAAGAVWVTAALLAAGGLLGALLGTNDLPLLLAGAVYLAVLAQVGYLSRQVGSFPVGAWVAFPLLFLFFVAVFVRSLVSTVLTRRVVWRGRTIPLGARRGRLSTSTRGRS